MAPSEPSPRDTWFEKVGLCRALRQRQGRPRLTSANSLLDGKGLRPELCGTSNNWERRPLLLGAGPRQLQTRATTHVATATNSSTLTVLSVFDGAMICARHLHVGGNRRAPTAVRSIRTELSHAGSVAGLKTGAQDHNRATTHSSRRPCFQSTPRVSAWMKAKQRVS